MRAHFVAAFVALAGCSAQSAVQVSVGATGVVRGVESLRATVRNGGVTALPLAFAPTGSPVDISDGNRQVFTLLFDPDRAGAVDLNVDALGAAGTLASVSATTAISPGARIELAVELHGDPTIADMATPPPDFCGLDLAPPDLAMPDLAPPDLSPSLPPDLATLPDLAMTPDTAMSYDMVPRTDMAVGQDLAISPDLAVPPDLAMPDMLVCPAPLVRVATPSGSLCAYVRSDGAILLAHYGAGTRQNAFSLARAQITDVSGGSDAPTGWAPTPDGNSGHLAYQAFNPAGKTVVLQCGTDASHILASVGSSTLFADFTDGDKGTYGATGTPGWAHLNGATGPSRSNHAACGNLVSAPDGSTGEIAYCNGPGAPSSWANHVVSYETNNNASTQPFVGCNGAGCSGPSCNLQVWVWLAPSTSCTPVTGVTTVATGQDQPFAVAAFAGTVYWANYNGGTIASAPLAGGAPTIIATGQGGPGSIAVDPSNVYWTNQSGNTVMQAPAKGGNALTIASGQSDAYTIAVDGSNVYWTTFFGGTVMKAPIGGGTATTLASGQSSPQGVAVDGNNVYWTTYAGGSGGSVYQVPLGGGSPIKLATGMNPIAVAVSGGTVFYDDYGAGTIASVPVGGGAPTTLASNQPDTRGIATDGKSVYWTQFTSGSLWKVPVGGGAPVAVVTGQSQPRSLAVDGCNVYWTNKTGSVMAAPK